LDQASSCFVPLQNLPRSPAILPPNPFFAPAPVIGRLESPSCLALRKVFRPLKHLRSLPLDSSPSVDPPFPLPPSEPSPGGRLCEFPHSDPSSLASDFPRKGNSPHSSPFAPLLVPLYALSAMRSGLTNLALLFFPANFDYRFF